MKLEFINAKGSKLSLTNNPLFKLTNVDGMTTSNVEISSSTVAMMDGDFVNNKRAIPRSIILDLAIENNVESTKREILKYIKPKQKGIIRWTQNEREIQIEGIVEAIEMPRFTSLATMQITLYCSQPFWEDINYIVQEISELLDLHYFTDYEEDMLYFTEEGAPMGEYDVNRTKVFYNTGDVEVGLEIRIIALGEVLNPYIAKSNGEFIGVNTTLHAGDEVIITTEKGNKKITLNGVNILSKIMQRSTWLQLAPGEEEFTINSDSGESNMYFSITYKQRYV